MAHSTQTEIEEQMEFEDKFRIIEEAVNMLFDDNNFAIQRRKWRQILHQIRTDDISIVAPQTRGFPPQAASVRRKETNFSGRDIIKAKNVAVYNYQNTQKNTVVNNIQNIQIFYSTSNNFNSEVKNDQEKNNSKNSSNISSHSQKNMKNFIGQETDAQKGMT